MAAEAVLLDAAAFRRQKPAAVLSALQTLEDFHKAQASVPGKALALLWNLSLITVFRPAQPEPHQSSQIGMPASRLDALITIISRMHLCVADMLSRLARSWRLVFSGPNKLAFLSYIPVDEDFVVKAEDGSLALESDLGPIRAKFKGRFEWKADSNEMHFAFNQAQVR